MQDKAKQILDKLKEINHNLSKRNKILIIGGVAAVLAIAIVGAILLNNSGKQVLFTDITQQEASEIVARIGEMGVSASYNSDGSITVPSESADTLRAQLVLQGYPKSGGLSYETFSSNIDMTSTDFEKEAYKLYDLQDRVAATIRHFDGVSDAVVNFSVGSDSKYVLPADKKEPTAWAMVYMKPGQSLDPDQVSGIQRLVAKSVAGLPQENVSVFDENMKDLTLLTAAGQEGGTAKLKRTLEYEFENSITAKILNLLNPVYGNGRVRVSVTSDVDVRKSIQEIITYTPSTDDNKGVIDQETSGVEVVGNGQVATGTPGTDTNAQVPVYPDVTFDGEEIYYKNDQAFDYLVSQMKEQIQNDGGDVLDVAVAVTIDKDGMSNAERNNVRDLIAVAARIDPELAGEKIAILADEFAKDAQTATGSSLQALMDRAWEMKWVLLGALVILILLIILITFVLKKVLRKKRMEAAEETVIERSEQGAAEELPPIKLEDIKKSREMELKEQIRDFAEQNPEISAQLIRTWLKGGGEDGR